MNTMHWPWLSLDLANLSGFTQWVGPNPVAIGHIRAKGARGKWLLSWQAVPGPVVRAATDSTVDTCGELVFDYGGPGDPLPLVRPWLEIFGCKPRLVVVERPFGKFRKADASLAERRGLVMGLAAMGGARVEVLNTGTWRRAATEAWGCTWLSEGDSERLKQQSVSLVREHFRWSVAVHDEAEALLVGAGALRARIVDLTTDGWSLPESDAARAMARERAREAKRAAKAADKQRKRGAKGSPLALAPVSAGVTPDGSL